MATRRAVIARFSERGLTIHPKKSKLFAESVDYLGYRISPEGIQPIHDKVQAIMDLVPPRTRRDIRRFVGMVSYRGGLDEQRAFEAVKSVLAQTMILAYHDPGISFHIYTDASGYQLGAVIFQRGRPVLFWSKKCNQAQRAYPANKRMLLSIVLLLRAFWGMLLGQELHIHTDHLNLTHDTFTNV
ncbi:TPA: hypothetical protein N0F65_005997 [Lagenidium giganteum]|uniref:Reverse transcriptase/retrotransposon-derived protein RNase H-like domain-containing protein n=1 Tax=Lagenidium giganteum TaxID=4803 RepID=A0AAV2Z8J8_9STRA|nr:TPA: hypothetical protein N0F65_005997 [Lagenidium giganteum]